MGHQLGQVNVFHSEFLTVSGNEGIGMRDSAVHSSAGKDALHIDFRFGRFELDSAQNRVDALCGEFGSGRRAGAADIVGADHQEELLGLSVNVAFQVIEDFLREAAGVAASGNMLTGAECFPPLMHIGDGVADEHYFDIVGRSGFQ